jgi:hypothetical protein
MSYERLNLYDRPRLWQAFSPSQVKKRVSPPPGGGFEVHRVRRRDGNWLCFSHLPSVLRPSGPRPALHRREIGFVCTSSSAAGAAEDTPVFAPIIKTATCHVPNTRRASAPKPRFSGRQPRIPESRFPHKPETVPWVLRAKTQSPAKDRGLPRRARQDWPAGPLLFFVLQIINHNS